MYRRHSSDNSTVMRDVTYERNDVVDFEQIDIQGSTGVDPVGERVKTAE